MKYQGLEAKVWGVGIGEEGCGQRAWKSDDREVGGREGGVQELLSRPPTPLLTDRGFRVGGSVGRCMLGVQVPGFGN